MPPRSPIAGPRRPSWSRGRIPAAITTMPASIRSSGASWRPVTPSPSMRTDCTPTPVRTRTSSASIWRCRMLLPLWSSCTGIRRGAISTTVVSRPSRRNALAASKPSSPPPTTAPARQPAARCAIASRSSSVRYTKTPAASTPGMGGTNGVEPVASTQNRTRCDRPDPSRRSGRRRRDFRDRRSATSGSGARTGRRRRGSGPRRRCRRTPTTGARGRTRAGAPRRARRPDDARRARARSPPLRSGGRPCRCRRRGGASTCPIASRQTPTSCLGERRRYTAHVTTAHTA